MLKGNTLGSGSYRSAQGRASESAFRGPPPHFRERMHEARGRENRGAMVHVLLHARNFPLKHAGSVQIFGLSNIREVWR
ncbi:hypothetical protein EV560_106147 [Bosea sp. BK604]|nr:hypothetical protein EV560_106147 [Bosea sp. BK604]